MSYLGAAVQAIVLRNPVKANEQKTKYMRNDDEYYKVFSDKFDLHVFLVCLELVKHFDRKLRFNTPSKLKYYYGKLKHLKYLAALLYFCRELQSVRFSPNDLANLVGHFPDYIEISKILDMINEACKIFAEKTYKRKKPLNVILIAKSSIFQTILLNDDFLKQFH